MWTRHRLPLFAVALLMVACEAEVDDGISEVQAERLIAALEQAGVPARKQASDQPGSKGRYRVSVPRADAPRALLALQQSNVGDGSERGFDALLEDGSWMPTATQDKLRFAVALGSELSQTLESVDGVLDARVHVALMPSAPAMLDDAPLPAKASVLLKQRSGNAKLSDAKIRKLVAGAVPGLEPANVSVVRVTVPRRVLSRQAFAYVGPIAVSRGSAALMRAVLAASLLLDLLLAGAVLYLYRKRRQSD